MGNGAHGADGRFSGAHRVTVESVPRLPTFPAAWTLADPRRCAYLVFWMGHDGSMYLSLRMEQIDGGRRFRSRRGAATYSSSRFSASHCLRTAPPRSCIGARGAGNPGAICTP